MVVGGGPTKNLLSDLFLQQAANICNQICDQSVKRQPLCHCRTHNYKELTNYAPLSNAKLSIFMAPAFQLLTQETRALMAD